MTVIRIQENRVAFNGGESLQAIVSFDHGVEYPITVSKPFTEEEEDLLEWYFEDYLRFPFTKQVNAQKAAKSITTYGHALFEQVFADPQARSRYQQARTDLRNLHFEIAGSPAFHALHWEALKDPDLPRPLVLDTTFLRRNLVDTPASAKVQPSPTINILLVSARPHEAHDMGYRTISRPLIEMLRRTKLPVQIDLLRPGTYRALENHLSAITNEHGPGYYHVIHFDAHGALLSYEQFQQIQQSPQTSNYVYNSRYGRDEIAPYEGVKAYLSLESEKEGEDDLLEAAELSNLLLYHGIPIVMLNACQSGKQVGASETSLGSRLMQAGVQLVLGMSYSVTVSAASLLMQTLYQRLLAGDDLAIAIRYARAELYKQKDRHVYFDQHIDLEDWLLPVVYQNQPVSLSVRQFEPEEEKTYRARQAELSRYDAYKPNYGFVGRDLDILRIEKRLLTKRNILLISGMGGAGKTTLLRHLMAWWRATNFVEQVFYFGYDERAWTRQQILTTIARQLLSKVEYVRDFQPLSPEEQQAKIAELLRAKRHLLILDNLESITGAQLAIQHTLSKKEQDRLHDFLTSLNDGNTLVLLGSRGSEDWLARGTFDDNIHHLGGLDPEAASLLTDRLLEKYKVTHYRSDPALQHLLKLLDGFPLALEVVLANLARQTPTDILTNLQAGNISLLDKKDTEKKTESIILCISYSHSNLSPEAQQLLLCLAPFTSVIYQPLLDSYTDSLRKQPSLSTLPFERWPEVLREAQNWGLLSPDPNILAFLRLQPILPYFLRERLNAPEQTEMRQAIENAFREHYDEIGSALDELLKSKKPEERQLGQVIISLEYENLVNALNLALQAQVSFVAPYLALSGYLDATQDHQRGLELDQTVFKSLECYPPEKLTGSLGFEFTRVIGDIALRQFYLKQFAEAEMYYQKALSLLLESRYLKKETAERYSASVYHQLGYIAYEQRRWEQAEQYYQQALQIRIEYNDRYEQAKSYHQLGIVASERRRWEQAEKYYWQAFQIWIEYNDRYEQAKTYGQLGTASAEQRRWEQAEKYYQQALQIEIEYNDRYSQAKTYHNLGIVAQEQRQWEQAEQYYQQALQIYSEYNDRSSQANTYHQLGWVAGEQGQWEQAEKYYQQALQLYKKYNDHYFQARTYHRLGWVYQEQQQWGQAKNYFLQALQIFGEYKDNYFLDLVLRSLSRLWKESGDTDLPIVVAKVLNVSVEEVEKGWQDGDEKAE